MEQFIIRGGKPLKGEIDVRGAKNAAFPILAATILTQKDCKISNLPLTEDVYRMIEILESMGARVAWKGKRSILINTRDLNPATIKKELMLKFRGSILLFGPLLARFGKVNLPLPGGDIIGPRPIDTHIDAFVQLGIKVRLKKKEISLVQPKSLKNTEVILNEFSVTATENILLFASLQTEHIILKTADQDYPIQELMTFLKCLGVAMKTSGLHVVSIKGKKVLRGGDHTLMYDPIEAGTFIVFAAASKGDVVVKNVEFEYLQLLLKKLKDFGIPLEIQNRKGTRGDVHVKPWKSLVINKIQSFIYPGIHSDLQSVLGVLATQATGSTLLHDPLYEGRLKYLEELNKMGAEVYFTDPHRAIINGPTQLYGTDLGAYDIRGGAAVIIGALIAKGKSTISNIYQVDRGYERIEERLQKLGADIRRISV